MKETITIMVVSLIFFVIVIATTLGFFATQVKAHDWYDKDCCSEHDCAPVLLFQENENGTLTLTSKHGTVTIDKTFSKRPSLDNQEHICMRASEDGIMYPICYYVPMGS